MNRSTQKQDVGVFNSLGAYTFGFIASAFLGCFFVSLTYAVYPLPGSSSLDNDLYYLEAVTDLKHINPEETRTIYQWVPVKKSSVELKEKAHDSSSVQNIRLGAFIVGFFLGIIICFFFRGDCFGHLLKRFPSLSSHPKWYMILLLSAVSDTLERSASRTLTMVMSFIIAFVVSITSAINKRDPSGFTEGAMMGFAKLTVVFAFGQNWEEALYSFVVLFCAFFSKIREIATGPHEKTSAERDSHGSTSGVEERKSI